MADTDWEALREEGLAGFAQHTIPPTLQLPALPLAVTRFIEASQDENVELRELAAIVGTDSGLTIELLKHVNSAYVGLRTKCKTVQQAISFLGMRQSKLLVITVGTQAAIRSRQSKLINQQCFWNSSLQRAIFARELAVMLRADPDVAFAGSLMQDYLLPVLTNEYVDQYTAFLADRINQPECLTEFEESACGFNHAVAAAAMAHRWKLPDDLVCCILYHHLGLRVLLDGRMNRTPVAAVALSSLLPDQLRQNFSGLEQLVLLEGKWKAFRFEELVVKVDEQHHELGLGVDNDFPLMRRCRQFLEQRKAALQQAREAAEEVSTLAAGA